MKNNHKPYIVYSYKLMRYLEEKGFKPFTTTQNKKFPDKVVFIYNNTDELLNEIEKYLQEK